MNFKAQNGKQLKKKKLPLRVPGCRNARRQGPEALIELGLSGVAPSAGATP